MMVFDPRSTRGAGLYRLAACVWPAPAALCYTAGTNCVVMFVAFTAVLGVQRLDQRIRVTR